MFNLEIHSHLFTGNGNKSIKFLENLAVPNNPSIFMYAEEMVWENQLFYKKLVGCLWREECFRVECISSMAKISNKNINQISRAILLKIQNQAICSLCNLSINMQILSLC